MALYLIGDVQGCDEPLGRLLDEIAFSPSRDTMVFLGDLVNRGPGSLAVLRRLQACGAAAQSLLGNHDLHLLGVAHGVRTVGRKDTLNDLLAAADRDALIEWLRHRPMALHRRLADGELLMVHAGVLPQWSLSEVLALAGEVERALRGPALVNVLEEMYGDQPSAWNDTLGGCARLRVIVNALTRLRFCSAEGVMEFESKDSAAAAPQGLLPWFDVPNRRTAGVTIAFGHWSTLGWM